MQTYLKKKLCTKTELKESHTEQLQTVLYNSIFRDFFYRVCYLLIISI